jgi:hypothetical protein
MRKLILATAATFVLAAPLAASVNAEEMTVRDHPNGSVTVREHAAPRPGANVVIRDHPNGNVVVREHLYNRAPAPRGDNLVIRDRVGPRHDNVMIKDR